MNASTIWTFLLVGFVVIWFAVIAVPAQNDCAKRGGEFVRGISISGYACVAKLAPAR